MNTPANDKTFWPQHTKRPAYFLIGDILIMTVSLYAAIQFRFDFSVPDAALGEAERTARAALDARLRRLGLLELPPETVLSEVREPCPAFAAEAVVGILGRKLHQSPIAAGPVRTPNGHRMPGPPGEGRACPST